MGQLTGKNHIGSQRSSDGEIQFTTYDPVQDQSTAQLFTEATSAEIDSAVGLAKEAMHEYGALPAKQKAEFLRAIADQIEQLGDDLIQVYCQETGLPEGRAKGERGRTMGQLRSFADLVEKGNWVQATIDTAQPNRQPVPKPDLRKMRQPLGPVAVFGASNFPLAYSTAGGDTASALAAGCPVVVKSHPMHAGTGELVANAITKAAAETGMPAGVFSNLNSSGIEVGVALVNHPGIKAVGFTGSIKGGRALFDLASKRDEPIPVFAEMGSTNPVLLLPQAIREQGTEWAKSYAASITLGAGQFCTNPGLLFGLKGSDLDAFVTDLSEAIETIEPSCMLHPNIKRNYQHNKEEVQAQNGVTVVAEYTNDVPPNSAQQVVVKVSGEAFINNPKLHQEVFGPFSMVVAFDDHEQMRAAIDQLEGQLTGTILGNAEELETYGALVNALKSRVGRLIFNGVPTGVEVCPAMHHGGPYPASTDSRFTAVGIHAIDRWTRPMSFQNWPDSALPQELRDANPLGITRLVNGELTAKAL
ncbi:aldehyde dehydrogenase (NADP(+)) [Flagellimonas sp. DF-77]|uniref:aldehyde dehydrogenase (NADP(+)) n=1 Tax=Flagellimonas algarum TaxID=3230298 RepID=UPI0033960273